MEQGTGAGFIHDDRPDKILHWKGDVIGLRYATGRSGDDHLLPFDIDLCRAYCRHLKSCAMLLA